MAKIMLLDDSPVMHRVVKLTFADDPRMEISVARTPEEAEQALASGHTDLIIAYARFVDDSPVSYFEALSFVSPRILLLAEDEENMEPFVQGGFASILRKPFHSDELRASVEELLSADARSLLKKTREPRRHPPVPPAPPSRSGGAPVPPAPPSRSSGAPVPPTPTSRNSSVDDDTATNLKKKDSFASLADVDESTRAVEELSFLRENSAAKAHPDVKGEPQITLDLSGLRQLAIENTTVTSRQSLQFSDSENSWNPPELVHNLSEKKSESSPRAGSLEHLRREVKRSIEPADLDDTPMSLENVMVSARTDNQVMRSTSEYRLTREDVETIVEEKVASAVDRAVRQALSETLPELRQAVVNEVSQRAVEQLSGELLELRQALRNSMSAELKELSAQWLRRETPSLAKDVIREEIRRVIETV